MIIISHREKQEKNVFYDCFHFSKFESISKSRLQRKRYYRNIEELKWDLCVWSVTWFITHGCLYVFVLVLVSCKSSTWEYQSWETWIFNILLLQTPLRTLFGVPIYVHERTDAFRSLLWNRRETVKHMAINSRIKWRE